MRTDVIKIGSNLEGRREAIEEAERFAAYTRLSGKYAMHLRLLTEETISMVHGILSSFEGDFWIESQKLVSGIRCRIYVAANTSVNEAQEDELMQMSSSGRNEEAKGILGMIREIFRWSVQSIRNDAGNDGNSTAIDLMYGMGVSGDLTDSVDFLWSLQQYRENLEKQPSGTDSRTAFDDLEKSIVANLSDEIKIGITDERATVIIERFFSNADIL